MKNTIHFFKEFISFFIIGGVIGWLIGLSQAPVITIIITSILSIITMFITFIAGINNTEKKSEIEPSNDPQTKTGGKTETDKTEKSDSQNENEGKKQPALDLPSKKYNIIPLVSFLLGLAIIATFGLWVKNNEKFIGIDLKNITNEWMSVLKYKNDYSLEKYEINKLKKDTGTIKKIDSIQNLIITDSLKLNKFNELLHFHVAKILFETRYGVIIDISYNISKESDPMQIKIPLITTREIVNEQKNLSRGTVTLVAKDIENIYTNEVKNEAYKLCITSNLEIMRKNAMRSGIQEIIDMAKQIQDDQELKNKYCKLCEK